ncbi:hypothetical protein NMY22_g8074 [Coprinellus aureogranulatus]|nr:hypothetical protein NMY22_g8074 [Coprinellus aureogranulatus]
MKQGRGPAPQVDPVFKGDKSRDVLVIVIGASGAGKSYYINRLLSAIGCLKRLPEGDTLSPCTSMIEPVIVEEKGWIQHYPHISADAHHARFIVIDTPGLDTGPTSSDLDILKRIALWVKKSYPRGLSDPDHTFLIGGVIYLHDLSRDKVPNVTQRNIRLLQTLLDGQLPLRSVVLVTTKWGREETTSCEVKEKEMIEDYWKGLIESSTKSDDRARTVRFGSADKEEESALEIIRPILRRFDQFVGEAALEGLRKVRKSIQGTRVKSEEFREGLKTALDKSILLHVRTLALKEGEATEEEIEVWAEELEKSKQDVYTLFGQFSTWDKVRFALTRK